MPDPTDLRTICSALDHFSLPAALGNLKDDALVFWNQAFQKRAGFSEIELAQARLNSLILLDESYSGLVVPAHDPENEVRFVPCVLKKSLSNEWVPGRALRREDGILLAMLDIPVGDIAFEGFIHGHLLGRQEERDRTRQFFHDILSSKLLVASFVAHEIYQSLAAKGAQEAEEQARITKLCGNSSIISAVLLKSLRYKPNPFLSVKSRAWTACWNPERLTELGECKPLGACTLNLKLSSSVLVRDLVFSNFNSVALSLDYTSMALSESPFLIRCESAGESKIAWPDVDFSYFVDYSPLIRG
jgi:hypothetical protein